MRWREDAIFEMTFGVLLRPDLGKRGYRMKCRFRIEAYPVPDRLKKATAEAAVLFIKDMRLREWEYTDRIPPVFKALSFR